MAKFTPHTAHHGHTRRLLPEEIIEVRLQVDRKQVVWLVDIKDFQFTPGDRYPFRLDGRIIATEEV